MRTALNYFSLTVACLLSVLCLQAQAVTNTGKDLLVGRIAHLEGKIYRYIEKEKDWVYTVEDAPFGLNDSLYTADEGQAEFIMPNDTWFRIGASTHIQLQGVDWQTTTLDVGAGMARFMNKSKDALIKVTTPYGYALVPALGVCDIYIGDDSLEIIAINGTIEFIHEASGSRFEVEAASDKSLVADAKLATEGDGTVDADWDDWNDKREEAWATRIATRHVSAEYVPEQMRTESYILDTYGRWEQVRYQNSTYAMWHPTKVASDWRPYTVGRWVSYYEDQCWIPGEPFGYLTHHYGSWVYIQASGGWYWLPPRPRTTVAATSVAVDYAWYPGRVSWMHSDNSVGWVPLTASEPYYSHNNWGTATKVVAVGAAVGATAYAAVKLGSYFNASRAVVVDRNDFYRGHHYRPRRERVEFAHFQGVPAVNGFFHSDRRRFSYSEERVVRRPDPSLAARIHANRDRWHRHGWEDQHRIRQEVKRLHVQKPKPARKGHAMHVSSRLVNEHFTGDPKGPYKHRKQRKLIKNKRRHKQARRAKQIKGQKKALLHKRPDPQRRGKGPGKQGKHVKAAKVNVKAHPAKHAQIRAQKKRAGVKHKAVTQHRRGKQVAHKGRNGKRVQKASAKKEGERWRQKRRAPQQVRRKPVGPLNNKQQQALKKRLEQRKKPGKRLAHKPNQRKQVRQRNNRHKPAVKKLQAKRHPQRPAAQKRRMQAKKKHPTKQLASNNAKKKGQGQPASGKKRKKTKAQLLAEQQQKRPQANR